MALKRDLVELALKRELLELVQVGRDGNVTIEDLSYYLNEQTRATFTNVAYLQLKQAQFSQHASQLYDASRAILLSGPKGAEVYHQRIAKALAHNFEAKLLLLDVTDLAAKLLLRDVTDLVARLDAPVILSKPTSMTDEPRGFGWSLADLFASPSSQRGHGSVGVSSPTNVPDAKASADCVASAERKNESPSTTSATPGSSRSSLSGEWWTLSFEEESFVDALFKVLRTLSETSPVVVYLRDVENFFFKGPKMYPLILTKMTKMKKRHAPIMILGSRINPSDEKLESEEIKDKLGVIFGYKINVKPPENIQNNARLVSWKSQVEEDMKAIQAQDNRNCIIEVLYANHLECDDILSVGFSDTVILNSCVEKVVMAALSHHLMNMEDPKSQAGRDPKYRAGKLLISAKSLTHGLSLFQAARLDSTNKLQGELKSTPPKDLQGTTPAGKSKEKSDISTSDSELGGEVDATKATATKATATTAPVKHVEVVRDNEFEKRMRDELIPAGEIHVSFQDIGGLENVKEALQELVMLPLRRPELFNRGGVIKRCKGILLFGPPGTGKTMLAKAVATEAGASFINVSMAAITSKWFGEDEKNVRALFTLAAKVSPTIIFIDEVDSMLGQRSNGREHECSRKIKNEFMAHWDGLLTKGKERVLVLAATNRPFDLDEAIIRRFERRIMVGLPDTENREMILRAILSKEELAEHFDFNQLATLTEGYSGSDLKNLCVAGAYRTIRELLSKERKLEEEKRKAAPKNENNDARSTPRSESDVKKDESADPPFSTLRPLSVEDVREAMKQVPASFALDGAGMRSLQDWNNLYGEGGSRKKQRLTYFL